MSAVKVYDPIGAGRRLKEVPWHRYVAMGDSVTEGVLGDPYPPYPEIGYAQMVADALEARRGDMRFFNLGKRYLTSRQIRESQLGRALELGPDLVILNAGANDMLLERFDPGITESELDRMAIALKQAGATVLIGTHFNMPAAGVMPDELADMLRPRFEAVNERVRAVAARNDIVLIDFAGLSWTADADLYSGDLQHLNRRGHAAAAEAIVERLAGHIGEARGSSGAV